MEKILDLIVNPIAGGRNGKKMRRVLGKLEERLNERKIEYRIHILGEHNGSKEKTENLIKEGATNIVAVGGDGTLHQVLNGITDFEKVNMGIIPCGTGNDFASAIGLPKDPVKALDLIIDGEAKYTDFMQTPEVRGLNVIGMGIDVDVLKRYNALKRKTKFGYTSCLIKTLMKFEYGDFQLEINGKKEIMRSFIVCACNGSRFGGGIPICPIADATDNSLDMLTVKEMKKLKIIGAFLKLKSGKVFKIKQTTHEKAEKIKVTVPMPYTVNVDGELYENIPFEVEIVKNKLKIYR